jgi:hypothetical protein
MYSTVSCNYVDIHFDYDWGEVGNSLYKNDVGFGMLSRETSSANSDKCFWYTENDIDMLFDIPFKISSIANTLGTLIGLMNFLYSLFLWCRVVTYLSIRFLCYVTVICIGLGILSQTVILSDMCMAGRCTQLPGPLGDTCVPSNCTLGELYITYPCVLKKTQDLSSIFIYSLLYNILYYHPLIFYFAYLKSSH